MEILVLLLAAFFVGFWMKNDADRLSIHIRIAEKMMAVGADEDTAMLESGCNFWDTPWYRRLFKDYPALPAEK